MNTFTPSTTGTRNDTAAAPSRTARIAGLIVSGLVVLFLLWDSIIISPTSRRCRRPWPISDSIRASTACSAWSC